MNLEQLIQKCEETKKEMHRRLDIFSTEIKRIEESLQGLPIDLEFTFPVTITHPLGSDEEIGYLFLYNDRIYFYWSAKKDSQEIVRRPLIEFPIEVRLKCKDSIVPFFEAVLNELGVY